jgi:hypothetical protein
VDNININLGETGYKVVDWIKIDQDRIQGRGIVKNCNELSGCRERGFMTSCNFSGRRLEEDSARWSKLNGSVSPETETELGLA